MTEPGLAVEITEGAWELRRRIAGVIWRLGVTCCMHRSSSGDAQPSSVPVSSWMLGSPRPSPAHAQQLTAAP
jgi:hypothetical protein